MELETLTFDKTLGIIILVVLVCVLAILLYFFINSLKEKFSKKKSVNNKENAKQNCESCVQKEEQNIKQDKEYDKKVILKRIYSLAELQAVCESSERTFQKIKEWLVTDFVKNKKPQPSNIEWIIKVNNKIFVKINIFVENFGISAYISQANKVRNDDLQVLNNEIEKMQAVLGNIISYAKNLKQQNLSKAKTTFTTEDFLEHNFFIDLIDL